MAPTATEALTSLVHQITSTPNISTLNQSLRNTLPKDAREPILASPMEGGADPLNILDLRNNTLGVLYILSARLSTNSTLTLPTISYITRFTQDFLPDHARLAPDRVTMLGRGIIRLCAHLNCPKLAIAPLLNLVLRYPYHPGQLTTLHQLLITQCLTTRIYTPVLTLLLEHPLSDVNTAISPDLHYTDNLIYQYGAGMILALLGKWNEAADWFEGVIGAPSAQGSMEKAAISALQVEAAKKLWLVQLISKGKIQPFPRYTHPQLLRLLKATPYQAFHNGYPHKLDSLHNLVQKEHKVFEQDQNLGLIKHALARAPVWAMKKLTATYLTLPLAAIGKAIGIKDEEQVRSLILKMIERDEISAQISTIPGTPTATTVTFSDPTPSFTPKQIDEVLKQIQNHASSLADLDSSIARSHDFITKAVKSQSGREGGEWGPGATSFTTGGDEELYPGISNALGGSTWGDDY